MTDDLSRKTVTFWDASGSYTHMAEAVVGQFGTVRYYVPYETGFPTPTPFLPGYGVDGIERIGVGQEVEDFWDAVELSDLVVFCDVGNYGLQEYLRNQGLPVFGSGRGGKLEQDRILLKSTMRKVSMDVANYTVIRGVDALRLFLLGDEERPAAPECYVKLSYFRGLAETFHHNSAFMTRSWIDELALEAGPYAHEIDFLIEMPLNDEPCVEVGIDTFTADGMFPDTVMWGYEAVKDNCFVGTSQTLPERLSEMRDKIAPELRRYGYRGPLSTETRESDERSSFIDLTARFPEPPSSLQRFMILNWAEIMWETAHGRIVEPEMAASYGVQIVWKSGYGKDHPLALEVGRMDRVTIHGHCVIEGKDYAVSPAELEEQGGACGLGDSVSAALEDAIDAADSIIGRDVVFDAGALDKISEVIEKGRQLGLEWS